MKLEGCVVYGNDVASYIQAEGDYYTKALDALKNLVPEGHILGSIRGIEK